jgi:hypothetical protein
MGVLFLLFFVVTVTVSRFHSSWLADVADKIIIRWVNCAPITTQILTLLLLKQLTVSVHSYDSTLHPTFAWTREGVLTQEFAI